MMTRTTYIATLVVGVFCVAGTSIAKDGPRPNEASKKIALYNIDGAIAMETVERVREHARRELRVATEIVEAEMEAGLDLQECAQAIAKEKEADHAIAIVFYKAPKDEEHIFIAADQGVSVINTVQVECDDAKKYAQRLERLMMRSAGTLAGLGFDPDPHCVMHSYDSVEDLDKMGRNFSPPWQAKFQKAATDMGLERIGPGNPSR